MAGTKRQRPQDTPLIEDDGPVIGSSLPRIMANSINGHGQVDVADSRGAQTLVMFLSSVCETCQHIIGPLNDCVTKITLCYNCFYDDEPTRYFCSYSTLSTQTCSC